MIQVEGLFHSSSYSCFSTIPTTTSEIISALLPVKVVADLRIGKEFKILLPFSYLFQSEKVTTKTQIQDAIGMSVNTQIKFTSVNIQISTKQIYLHNLSRDD